MRPNVPKWNTPMTDNIVQFQPKKSLDPGNNEQSSKEHLAGEAKCIACQHSWVAVGYVGTVHLECPACGLTKGAFMNPILRSTEPHWRCNCGNDLFFITQTGCYCPNCGVRAIFDD